MERWIHKTDSLQAFVSTHVESLEGCRVVKKDFYESYVAFCRENEMAADSLISVGDRLPHIIPTKTVRTSPRSWGGISVAGIQPIEVRALAEVKNLDNY